MQGEILAEVGDGLGVGGGIVDLFDQHAVFDKEAAARRQRVIEQRLLEFRPAACHD